MIVTNDDFIEFIQEYYKDEFPHQRVGQAFVNKFFEGIHIEGEVDNGHFTNIFYF